MTQQQEALDSNLAARMARVMRHDVRSMHGYAVQPSAGMVKVDTMENPFPLPEHLRRALGERLAQVALNRYPAERSPRARRRCSGRRNGFSIVSTLTMPADGCTA